MSKANMKLDLKKVFRIQFVYRQTKNQSGDWFIGRIDSNISQDGYPYHTHLDNLKITCIKGQSPVELVPGAEYTAQVRLAQSTWNYETTYFYQLVSVPELVMPADAATLIRLLTRCEGVGSATAKKLVESYGINVMQTIASDPAVLNNLGLKEKAEKSLRAFCEDLLYVGSMSDWFDKVGIPAQYREELLYRSHYLARDIRQVYEICYGILPWEAIEEIAERTGIPEHEFHRLQYLVREAVRREIGSSSCMLLSCLGPAVDRLLYDNTHFKNVSYTDAQILDAAQVYHVVCLDVPEMPMLYPRDLHDYEHQAAWQTASLLTWPGGIAEEIPDGHPALAGLCDEQKNAVRMALSHHLSVITGGPGTGKTYVTQRIIQAALSYNSDLQVVLMAPTARAAQRLTEVTGYEARTLDSALKIQCFNREQEAKQKNVTFKNSLVIVDEMSMCDIVRYKALARAVDGETSTLILIGDSAQLPAIGYGDVLGTLTQMPELIPQCDFQQVHRQAGGSSIPEIAQTIRLGTDEDINSIAFGGDCILTECAEADILDRVLQSYKALRSQGVSMDEIMILTPVHDGLSGRHMINAAIQAYENPCTGKSITCEQTGEKFYIGDRVMNLKNKGDIANGNIGRVTEITDKTIVAEFATGTRRYTQASMDELTLAYALTVHKSQGSEAAYVIMPVSSDSRQSRMYTNSLLYTGLTRGKRHVEIIGSKRTFLHGCCSRGGSGRTTLFGIWIESGLRCLEYHRR